MLEGLVDDSLDAVNESDCLLRLELSTQLGKPNHITRGREKESGCVTDLKIHGQAELFCNVSE